MGQLPLYDSIVRRLEEAWRVIRDSPEAALFLFGLGLLAMWLWDKRRVAILRAREEAQASHVKRLEYDLQQYKEKLQGATPEEAKKLIAELQAQTARISPRLLSDGERAKLEERARVPDGKVWRLKLTWYPFDDGERLAQEYKLLFNRLGWHIDSGRIIGGAGDLGITLKVADLGNMSESQRALRTALGHSALHFTLQEGGPTEEPHLHIGYAERSQS